LSLVLKGLLKKDTLDAVHCDVSSVVHYKMEVTNEVHYSETDTKMQFRVL